MDLLNVEHQENGEEKVYLTTEPEDITPTRAEVLKAIKILKILNIELLERRNNTKSVETSLTRPNP